MKRKRLVAVDLSDEPMHITGGPFANSDIAARKLIEIASTLEPALGRAAYVARRKPDSAQ